jgi:cell division septal protein FtsQ
MAAARITLRQITAIVAGTLRHAATRQRLTPTLHLTALAAVVAITVAVEAVLRTAAVVVAAGTPEVAEAAILAAVAITKSS